MIALETPLTKADKRLIVQRNQSYESMNSPLFAEKIVIRNDSSYNASPMNPMIMLFFRLYLRIRCRATALLLPNPIYPNIPSTSTNVFSPRCIYRETS